MKPADPKLTAGRAFVRSLNILLKFARLYGFDHVRTNELLEVAFRELRTAIPEGTDAGLLLGATGNQLLLDGVPLEGSPAEKQFAQLLSAAGLASVQFFPSITAEELTLFARAFPTGKSKPAELAEQLKTTLPVHRAFESTKYVSSQPIHAFATRTAPLNSPPQRLATIRTNSSSGSTIRKSCSR